MQELIFSSEFGQYRKALIVSLIASLTPLMVDPEKDAQKLAGALSIARKVLPLPEDLIKDKKLKQQAKQLVIEDFNEMQVRFIRHFLIEE